MYILDKYVSIYISYDLITIKLQPLALVNIQVTLLANALEHIYLLHHTCMFHCTSNMVYMSQNQLKGQHEAERSTKPNLLRI